MTDTDRLRELADNGGYISPPEIRALLSERQENQERIAELEQGIRILQDNWPKTIPAPMDSLLSSSGGDE